MFVQCLYNLHFLGFSLVKCQVCSSWPGNHSRIASIQTLNTWTAGSAGGYGDDRTMGEKVKDALPGTGRGGSTTGHSSGQGYGQGYSQEGRGVTSGTGKFMPLLASAVQPHVETL